jgi:hypothetical protein
MAGAPDEWTWAPALSCANSLRTRVLAVPSSGWWPARSVEMWTVKPVRDFLASRRARITPERAGLPRYGEKRRVPGLRREEVASLAGVSFDYYARLERRNLATAASAT